MKSPQTVWSALSIIVLVVLFAAAGIWVFSATSNTRSQMAAQLPTPTIPLDIGTPTPFQTPFIPTPPRVTPYSGPPTVAPPTSIPTGFAVPTRAPAPTIDADRLPVVTSGSLTGWRIYENTQFGFRLKFPPYFKIGFGEGFPWQDALLGVGLGDTTSYKTNPLGVPFSAGLIVFDNPKRLPVEDFFRSNHSRNPRPGTMVSFWTGQENPNPPVVQLPSSRALRFTNYGYGGQLSTYLIPFPGNDKMIQFSFDEAWANDPTGKANRLFDSIASAIEFIR